MASDMEEPGNGLVTDVRGDMSMSRGEKPDLTINFQEIENLTVLDEQGNKIRFGDIYKDKKTIIVFVRHFLCFICKEYVEDLAAIPEKFLREANVQLVVIGCGQSHHIKPFRNMTGYKLQLYVDPDRELYKKLNFLEHNKPGRKESSKHIKSGFIMGLLTSTWRAMRAGREWQGDVNQQGGQLILGPSNLQHYAHIDQNSADHTPINDLLIQVGVEPVNFAKDQRVLTL